ncbi:MAG: hypothetical protein CMJ20_05850 [Phycisphaeraceae bacterium]|nr:hypothetical protein [Phycisphaeraceae bacterium]
MNYDGLVDVADLGIIGDNFSMTQVTYMDGDLLGSCLIQGPRCQDTLATVSAPYLPLRLAS